MRRIKRGWALTKKSWSLLRGHPGLLRFPLYGAVASTVATLVVVGPGLYLIDQNTTGAGVVLLAVGLYVLALVGLYFSVGLAAAADMTFRGREASFGDDLAVSRERFGAIAGWAALSAVVGVLLSLLEDQGGIAGAIFGRLLEIGWSLITFLAVPVIALEGSGPLDTLKRSASLFRDRWGQQVTGNLAIGGAVALLGVLPGVALIAGGIAIWAASGFAGAILVVIGVVILAVAMVISRALSGIFGVALYRYALDGEAVGGFSADELESDVRTKGAPAPSTI
ncbi:MAG: DUF6159 family protein [Solirubrobacterales bacterium]